VAPCRRRKHPKSPCLSAFKKHFHPRNAPFRTQSVSVCAQAAGCVIAVSPLESRRESICLLLMLPKKSGESLSSLGISTRATCIQRAQQIKTFPLREKLEKCISRLCLWHRCEREKSFHFTIMGSLFRLSLCAGGAMKEA
jgi:hypothetical protein